MWPFKCSKMKPKKMASTIRKNHYIFAHIALRSIAFNDPLRFLAIMASPDAQVFLRHIWEKVGEDCPAKKVVRYDGEFPVFTTRVHGFPAVMIQMPPPATMCEAYMIGVVVSVEMERQNPPEKNPPIQYLTLERSETTDGREVSVLCKWQGEGDNMRHINMGRSCSPDLHSFAKMLEDNI